MAAAQPGAEPAITLKEVQFDNTLKELLEEQDAVKELLPS